MVNKTSPLLNIVYPICSGLLPGDIRLIDPMELPEFLATHPELQSGHAFLADLAVIERARYRLEGISLPAAENIQQRLINPALELLPVQWRNLPEFLNNQTMTPQPGESFVLVYKQPDSGQVRAVTPSSHDLLALKIVAEGIDSRQAALEGKTTIGKIDDILYLAIQHGLLLAPKSKIVRSDNFPREEVSDQNFFSTPTFTLQWHITQVCDLHCRHCYDRSDRKTMELAQAIRVVDDLYDFCQAHNVFTQVTFTGGNPLLYPHFNELYREAADRGFLTAILGNPMPRHRMEKMLAIRKPEFYQVSLEGLREHNDYIRGKDHFDRIFKFLDLLRELDIYSMVMLTLTRANMEEVLELAELLRDRVDLFTFNRLAMMGEGAALASALTDKFPEFLRRYMKAAETNPCMSLKDNLFNLLRHKQGMPYVGGCAGHGCGAAFNFVSLLPDGEVHACRKLPSYIGNMYQQSLDEIYHGELARKYRAGSSACNDCKIRPVCGGCLAVTYGFGKDIFTELDPYCFRKSLNLMSPELGDCTGAGL